MVDVGLRSGRDYGVVLRKTDGSQPILVAGEEAGATLPFGCRMGICRTCRCRKLTGVVENVLTGAVSSEPDEDVQPCISVARSDVELGL